MGWGGVFCFENAREKAFISFLFLVSFFFYSFLFALFLSSFFLFPLCSSSLIPPTPNFLTSCSSLISLPLPLLKRRRQNENKTKPFSPLWKMSQLDLPRTLPAPPRRRDVGRRQARPAAAAGVHPDRRGADDLARGPRHDDVRVRREQVGPRRGGRVDAQRRDVSFLLLLSCFFFLPKKNRVFLSQRERKRPALTKKK